MRAITDRFIETVKYCQLMRPTAQALLNGIASALPVTAIIWLLRGRRDGLRAGVVAGIVSFIVTLIAERLIDSNRIED